MQQLPVLISCKNAINYAFNNITFFLNSIIIWVLFYIILIGIFIQVDGESYKNIIDNYFIDNANKIASSSKEIAELFRILLNSLLSFSTLTNFLYILMLVISFIAYCSVAISWHRAYLLNEKPALFRVGLLEIKYFIYSILITLILYALLSIVFVLISLIFSLIFSNIFAIKFNFLVKSVLFGGLILLIMLIFVRFSLIFPGIAINDRRMNFKRSFEATKGNSWRLLGGVILCILPTLIINFIVNLIHDINLPLIIELPLLLIQQLISSIFLLSFMSICYKFFISSPKEDDLI